MGMRKKNNQREALRRKEAKIRRDKNKLKRIRKAAAKTTAKVETKKQ